jgi:hypothetical protein
VRRLWLLVLLAGCKQIFGLSEPTRGDGGVDAAAADASADAIPDAGTCTGASLECVGDVLRTCSGDGAMPVDTACAWGCGGGTPHCQELVPSGNALLPPDLVTATGLADVVLSTSGLLIDGDSGAIGTLSNPSLVRGPGTGVIAGIDYFVRDNVAVFRFASLHISSGVAPVGNHAVAFVSLGNVSIDNIVDLRAPCVNGGGSLGGFSGGATATSASGSGGGGGGNGSIGGNGGGHGGTGGRGGSNLVGALGMPFGDNGISMLVGGGGGGGGGGAKGGNGGGALQIVSNTRIDISGGINAGGCGGASSAANSSGGGGGGAGGTILLEAPAVAISGALAVNGGGGGGIGQSGTGASGTLDRIPAPGDTGTIADGGAGAAGAMADGGNGMTNGFRGGGGGGAIGRIRIDTHTGSATIANPNMLSPAPNDPGSTCTIGMANVQ